MSEQQHSFVVLRENSPPMLTPLPVQAELDTIADVDYRHHSHEARRLGRFGAVVIGMFCAAIGIWAYFAELSSAAIASGVVTVASNQRTVQHLEGGIVEDILVGEGDSVTAGQKLITLQGAAIRSRWEILTDRKLSTLTLIDRLMSERLDKPEVEFRTELLTPEDQRKAESFMRLQRDLFASRRANWTAKNEMVAQRVAQFDQQINGLRVQLNAQLEEKALIERELGAVTQLTDQKLLPMTGQIALQRQLAQINGDIGQSRAAIAETEQKISEARLGLIDLQESRLREIVEELRSANEEWQTVQDLLPEAEDALRRLDIRSPIDGTIVGMQVHTVGGVVAPGSPLMKIVPKDDTLVVEARINPSDIDVVHAGLSAQVRLTALSRRSHSPIKARVLWVSADGIADNHSGGTYFLARLEFTEDPDVVFGKGVVNPGMMAEVILLTERNTTLDYVVEPINRLLTRAFREG